jgi:similar to stage IV sporulation protein
VEKVLVLSGVPMVKEGDLVHQGQVLISGTITSAPETPETTETPEDTEQAPLIDRTIRAQGVVDARVWYRGYGEAALASVERQFSGRQTRTVAVRIRGKEIIIKGPGRIPYANYQRTVTRRKFPQWRNITLPVEFVTIEAKELKQVSLRRSRQEAISAAVKSARKQIGKLLPADVAVVKQQVRLLEAGDDNLVRVLLTCETVEDLARVSPLNPIGEQPATP